MAKRKKTSNEDLYKQLSDRLDKQDELIQGLSRTIDALTESMSTMTDSINTINDNSISRDDIDLMIYNYHAEADIINAQERLANMGITIDVDTLRDMYNTIPMSVTELCNVDPVNYDLVNQATTQNMNGIDSRNAESFRGLYNSICDSFFGEFGVNIDSANDDKVCEYIRNFISNDTSCITVDGIVDDYDVDKVEAKLSDIVSSMVIALHKNK